MEVLPRRDCCLRKSQPLGEMLPSQHWHKCFSHSCSIKRTGMKETYRLRFRSLSTPADETPTELYIRLKDLFSKWVHYEQSNKRDIMESLVLEQYLRVLYPEVKTWVKERDPDTAAEAASLVEAYIAARKGPGATRYAGILHSLKGKSDGLGGGFKLSK
uniref:SCAN box domain-containing protein n=1 Tax=Cyprinus carpio carpio TaxID=630221 RepID=A0A9J7YPB4_CYPCA